jgi:hypothetical protein
MGGPGSGHSSKRTTLPRAARPGWLKRMDGRSTLTRELHERLAAIADDLGGLDQVSAIERSLIERFIHSEGLAAQIEEAARDGEDFDCARYLALVDRVVRIAQALGLRRRMKPTEDLHAYMRRKAAEKEGGVGGS